MKHTEQILLLDHIECRNMYENATLPIQFQGSAYAVVRLTDSQKHKAIYLLENDGNGGWNNHKKNWTRMGNFSDRKLLFTSYYRNRLAKGFSKALLYQTADKNSEVAYSYIAVVKYYWSKTNVPTRFECKKQRSTRSDLKKLLDAITPVGRQKAATPGL